MRTWFGYKAAERVAKYMRTVNGMGREFGFVDTDGRTLVLFDRDASKACPIKDIAQMEAYYKDDGTPVMLTVSCHDPRYRKWTSATVRGRVL